MAIVGMNGGTVWHNLGKSREERDQDKTNVNDKYNRESVYYGVFFFSRTSLRRSLPLLSVEKDVRHYIAKTAKKQEAVPCSAVSAAQPSWDRLQRISHRRPLPFCRPELPKLLQLSGRLSLKPSLLEY